MALTLMVSFTIETENGGLGYDHLFRALLGLNQPQSCAYNLQKYTLNSNVKVYRPVWKATVQRLNQQPVNLPYQFIIRGTAICGDMLVMILFTRLGTFQLKHAKPFTNIGPDPKPIK